MGIKDIRPLQIGNLKADIPVIQAGMGVQVAKSKLAGAVAKAGGIGCISTVGLGTLEGSLTNYIEESNKHLAYEIREARRIAPNGIIAVNILGALSNFDELVKVCVREEVDMIISGAGLPLKLPEQTKGSNIKLVPVVSSARTMNIILRAWHRKSGRIPDAVVVEGPLCGGHMAFTWEDLRNPERVPINRLYNEIKNALAPYEAEYGRTIPLIGAENIADSEDVLKMLSIGFDGVQVGTRFICTEESGIDPKSKQIYVKARSEDIVLIQSPLGLPVKVLRTPLTERLLKGEKIPFRCPFLCLKACNAKTAKFCLAEALVNTLFGETEKGLFMTGNAIGRINNIIPAEEFLEPMRKLIE